MSLEKTKRTQPNVRRSKQMLQINPSAAGGVIAGAFGRASRAVNRVSAMLSRNATSYPSPEFSHRHAVGRRAQSRGDCDQFAAHVFDRRHRRFTTRSMSARNLDHRAVARKTGARTTARSAKYSAATLALRVWRIGGRWLRAVLELWRVDAAIVALVVRYVRRFTSLTIYSGTQATYPSRAMF